ncbi:MAG: aldehyde dehydrogenase family protein [Chromatiales bacterium]|nr:aldehyde dehydrogenase family protein [Chromatiales bacterium]
MIAGAATSGPAIELRAPYDGRLLATLESADARAVEQALETAHALWRDRDGWLTPANRIEILERTQDIMRERAETLALEAAEEGGKPLADSRVEVARAIDGIRICIDELRTVAGRVIPMGINAASLNRVAFTQREPIGVVVAISAFNHPLNLIVHQVAPAVATGCPVIVKPAEKTPRSCMRFVSILREAGLPAAWCQALVTPDLAVAERLVSDSRVGFLSFIGSARVGWMLRSKLAPGARCALEHGGAAPVIVSADADLDAAVPALAKAGFYHAGQVCVSVQRVFAERAIAAELAERIAAAGRAMRIGDPTDPKTEIGPLIRASEIDRVDAWLKEAIAAGARHISGAKRVGASCYEATVLLDAPGDARVSREEIFGPAIMVYGYDELDQAIERANALPYAFQAAVYTRDLDTALRVSRRIDASAVMVNDHTAFRVDWMPFAGLRHSGHGVGGIPYTMHDMSIEKMTVIRSSAL